MYKKEIQRAEVVLKTQKIVYKKEIQRVEVGLKKKKKKSKAVWLWSTRSGAFNNQKHLKIWESALFGG